MKSENRAHAAGLHHSHGVPLALGIGYFCFGWFTLSHQYTFDAISYLWDVENSHLAIPLDGSMVTYNFFHSQHLLFSPIVYVFYHAWALFGYGGSALLPAQILNLMEGALTLALTFTLLCRITDDKALSLLSVLLLGFSFSFWDNTAMVSDHMASCLFAVVFFGALLNTDLDTASYKRVLWLGILVGGAFLMHQVNGLLGFVFIAALLMAPGNPVRRLRLFTTFTLAALCSAFIPYLLIGIVVLGNTTVHDFFFWCFYYAMPGVIDVAGHYGTVGFGKVLETAESFGASIVGGFYWMNRGFETRFLQRTVVPIIAALAAVPFLFAMLHTPRAKMEGGGNSSLYRKAGILSAAWFILYAVLLFWWWPTYYQLWAVPMVAFILFVAVSVRRRLKSPLRYHPAVLIALGMVVAAVLTANAISAFAPAHDLRNNDYYATTMSIGGRTTPGDLIVIPGNDEYETYIPYFIHRDIVSLHARLIEHLNDIDGTFEEIRDSMRQAWSNGHGVFIVSELRDSAIVYADVYDLHHLSNAEVAGRFRQFQVQETIETRSVTFYKLRRPEKVWE